MGSPEVPIDVDPETGIWRTDGLPMIYLPRHFLVNNHLAVEAALERPPSDVDAVDRPVAGGQHPAVDDRQFWRGHADHSG